MQRGFSLVELSIVLVILGLLTGGILAGKSLIRASELRSVTSEYQRYVTATQTFRDKYFGIPGDFNKATSFWGAVNTGGANGNCSTPQTDTGTGTQTCNGNGNNAIGDRASVHEVVNEVFRFWQHLANAGLIEGNYSGVATDGMVLATRGSNVPVSKLGNGCWDIDTPRVPALDGSGISYGNRFVMGGPPTLYGCGTPIITPSEAWNIDTKLDDGKPRRGKVMSFNSAALCSSSSNIADLTADYSLGESGKICSLLFPNAF